MNESAEHLRSTQLWGQFHLWSPCEWCIHYPFLSPVVQLHSDVVIAQWNILVILANAHHRKWGFFTQEPFPYLIMLVGLKLMLTGLFHCFRSARITAARWAGAGGGIKWICLGEQEDVLSVAAGSARCFTRFWELFEEVRCGTSMVFLSSKSFACIPTDKGAILSVFLWLSCLTN